MEMQAQPITDHELDGIFQRSDRLQELADKSLIVLAVSGGADSMALMHLYKRYFGSRTGIENHAFQNAVVATVDHDLRPDSANEAEWVRQRARALGFEHVTLTWTGDKPDAGIQQAARKARYGLMLSLSEERGKEQTIIVTAHHRDDQAETLLMRLARGSGLDGLSAMQRETRVSSMEGPRSNQATIWRPLLDLSKERLRTTLRTGDVAWIEDPSNENDQFERVRLRRSRGALEAIGLTNEHIALSARRLTRARDALAQIAQRYYEAAVHSQDGAFGRMTSHEYLEWPEDIKVRVLSMLIRALGGRGELPNMMQVEDLMRSLSQMSESKSGFTLGGCVVQRDRDTIIVCREAGRQNIASLQLDPGDRAVWDQRFIVELSDRARSSVDIVALGAKRFRDLRASGLLTTQMPTIAASCLPVFMRSGRLVSVPHLGYHDQKDPETQSMTLHFAW